MRRAVVILEVSDRWIESMAPASHWLDFLIEAVNRGLGSRGKVGTAYTNKEGYVVMAIRVSDEWIKSMAPSFEWVGFLAGRVERGVRNKAQVVNAYEGD